MSKQRISFDTISDFARSIGLQAYLRDDGRGGVDIVLASADRYYRSRAPEQPENTPSGGLFIGRPGEAGVCVSAAGAWSIGREGAAWSYRLIVHCRSNDAQMVVLMNAKAAMKPVELRDSKNNILAAGLIWDVMNAGGANGLELTIVFGATTRRWLLAELFSIANRVERGEIQVSDGYSDAVEAMDLMVRKGAL